MDAFSVAIAKGTTVRDMTLVRALKYGLLFGVVEGLAPVVGWLLGQVASQWIADYDHWIGFGLLTLLGLRCIYEALFGEHEEAADTKAKHGGGFWLFITAIATSIDAMVVGVSLAFLQVNIWLAAIMIGLATTIMSASGLYLGRRLGEHFGQKAMIAGGVVLMAIGAWILASHLTA